MPGKVDEPIWERAKAAAKKGHPDWDEKNPRLWKLISSIYKKMGGKFSKEMAKSLEAIESAVAMTPAAIEDPRLWIGAIVKSFGVTIILKENQQVGTVYKEYVAMGGKLMKSSVLDTPIEESISKSIAGQFSGHAEAPGDLEKAAGGVHKYASRVARPGGGFRYIYPDAGGASGAAKPAAQAKKPAGGPKAPEADKSKTDMSRIVDRLGKKDAQSQRAALQNHSDEDLDKMHAGAHKHAGLQKVISEERSARKAKAAKQAVETRKSQEAFSLFKSKYADDIRKSLSESHPEWDAKTLERRLDPQIRQMFRYHGE